MILPINRQFASRGFLLFVLIALAGCGKSNSTATAENPGDAAPAVQPAADPWKEAATSLRRENSKAECKTTLTRLNLALGEQPDREKPSEVTPEAMKNLASVVPLSEMDRHEIASASFTPLDGPYLAECFYLRDAARSLDAAGLPPAQQATLAFEWVCRQVYLNPWALKLEQNRIATALTPSQVLPRGYGSGLERAYVFLGLLQQLGLDGCFIGPPDSSDKFATFFPLGADGKPLPGFPRGPFWAVGVLVGKDILLFDPWRGEAFPGTEGKGTGTLAQIRANPEQLRSWFDDKTHPWLVTPAEVKAATIYLARPVSSWAPRLAMLESKCTGDVSVKLFTEPSALLARFTEAAKAANATVAFWNPERDRFSYNHTLAANLPKDDGGWDDAPNSMYQVWGMAVREQIPPIDFRRTPELAGAETGLVSRLEDIARNALYVIFLTPPTARERLQRGQFQEAARMLVEKQDLFRRGIELVNSDRSRVKPWIEKMNKHYVAFETARLNRTPTDEARDLIEQGLRSDPSGQQLVDALTAEYGVAEATFQLAICKNELAERAQARFEQATTNRDRLHDDAKRAWAVARDSWDSYDFRGRIQANMPGRAEYVKTMSERAKTMAEK